jgi:hypothetical protein
MYTKNISTNMTRIVVITALIAISIPLGAASTNAATTSSSAKKPVQATGVIQSYNADAAVVPSMLVELKPKDKSTAIPLVNTDINKMIGVVIPHTNASLVLTPSDAKTQQVYVAQSGTYNVLVCDQNGPIKVGDSLTMSALPGIAMRADSSQPSVTGKSIDAFNGSKPITRVTLKVSASNIVKVAVGRISVNVQLAPNPLYLKSSNSIFVFLSRAEYGIVNKPVGPIRTYIVGLLFLATIITTIVVMYSGTRSSITSIGRNPLAKSAIGRGLLKTVIGGLFIFGIGIGMTYLILNR